jgi:hypothetical protein
MFLSAIAGWLLSRFALSTVVVSAVALWAIAVAEYWTSLILIGLSVLLLVTGIC